MCSDRWKEKRAQRMRIDHNQCAGCGKQNTEAEPLQCHHLNYYDFTHENVWTSIVMLCPDCHERMHNVMNRCTGVLPDGTPKMGWRKTLPEHVKAGLRRRGLM